MPHDFQITIDCVDPAGLAGFYAEALGYQLQDPPPGFKTWDEALDAMNVPMERRNDVSALNDPEGTRSKVLFQRVPEGKTAKNRVHLDVRAAPGLVGDERMNAFEAEAERLQGLGASRLQRLEPAPPLSHGHIVMADPEGN